MPGELMFGEYSGSRSLLEPSSWSVSSRRVSSRGRPSGSVKKEIEGKLATIVVEC